MADFNIRPCHKNNNDNVNSRIKCANEAMECRRADNVKIDIDSIREQISEKPGNKCSGKTRNELLHDIQSANFAAIDLQLYLNTHPDDSDVLELYRAIVKRLKRLVKEFEESFGPLTPYGDDGKNEWSWIKSPWPWEIKE